MASTKTVTREDVLHMAQLSRLTVDDDEIARAAVYCHLHGAKAYVTLNTLLSTGIANKDNVRFFLGYSGWDAGQLANELERNTWIVCPTDSRSLFSTPPETMWKHYVDRMGARYKIWSQYPRNPENN